MKPTVARLLIAAALFLGWLGYLGYLVVCRPHTPSDLRGAFEGRYLTLSRPQFLVSALDVVAEVSGDKGEKVVVKEVLFPKTNPPVKVGEEIQVQRIDLCRAVPEPLAKNTTPPLDYVGPGAYLLPLQAPDRDHPRRFEVVPTPPSPGFPRDSRGIEIGPPRIYPASEELLAEYRQIAK
jgi:hypothetical protein